MSDPVPFVDIVGMQRPAHDELKGAFARMLSHGRYVLGPEVADFEAQLADYASVQHAVGVSSGTDALLATFLALELPPGSEVITTPFTFISTATSVLRAGLRPVFVDLPEGQMHPGPAEIEAAITAKTSAVLVVHLFGAPLDLDATVALCDRNGLALVEDCAQAIGARWPTGQHVGSRGVAGTLSFFPAKNLGALGDGGAVLTNDAELARKVRAVRQHGCEVKYLHERLGGNFRLDALQAAMLKVLLPHLDGWVASRRANAAAYRSALADQRLAGLQLPPEVPGHTYNQFVVRSDRRDELRQRLLDDNIGCAIYYPYPLHTQVALQAAQPAADLPGVERRCREVLALPIAPGLTADGIARVVECIRDVHG